MDAAGVVAIMLVAGVFHAGWNLVAKRVHTDRMLLLVAASALIAIVLLPWGITHIPARSTAIAVACVVLRGTLNVAYLVGLSRSYHYFDLSLAYPLVRGIGPVVAVVGAVLLLGERPALIGLVGVAVISVAILGMAATASSPSPLTPAPDEQRRLRGAAVVVLTGVTIGAYTVVDKVGVSYWDPVAYLWGVEVTGLLIASAYLLHRRKAGELVAVVTRNFGDVALCAAFIAASYLLALFALQHTLASYVAPLREVSVLFGALLGMLVLKEDHGPRRVLAAAAIATGLVLVGLAL